MCVTDENDPRSELNQQQVAVKILWSYQHHFIIILHCSRHVSFHSATFSSGSSSWMPHCNCFKRHWCKRHCHHRHRLSSFSIYDIHDIYIKLFWTLANKFTILLFWKWANVWNFCVAQSIDSRSYNNRQAVISSMHMEITYFLRPPFHPISVFSFYMVFVSVLTDDGAMNLHVFIFFLLKKKLFFYIDKISLTKKSSKTNNLWKKSQLPRFHWTILVCSAYET